MLLEIVCQSLADGLVHGTRNLGVSELRLRLPLELRLCHLHADNGRKTFAEVLAADFYLRLLNLLLRRLLGILLQHARKSLTEAHEMRTTLDGVDIVDVAVDVLAVRRVVHDGNVDGEPILVCRYLYDVVEEVYAAGVDVAHELRQPLLREEHLAAGLPLLAFSHVGVAMVPAEVGERNGQTSVQECQLAHPVCKGVVVVFRHDEDRVVRPELLARTAALRLAHHLHGVQRLPLLVLLLVYLSVAEHLRRHVLRERIHAADAHAVQTAADLIAALVELTAGMQHRHYDLQRRAMLLRMLIDGNAASVVLDDDAVVLAHRHLDVRAEPRKGFVDTIVNGFVNQVVQSLFADVADVHRGALPYRLKSFKHLNVARRVVGTPLHVCFFHVCVWYMYYVVLSCGREDKKKFAYARARARIFFKCPNFAEIATHIPQTQEPSTPENAYSRRQCLCTDRRY